MGIGDAVAVQALSGQQAVALSVLKQAAAMEAQIANMLASSTVPAGSLGQTVNISV